MQTKSDVQLLREYASSGSEGAFTEIVRRHTDFIYSAALRQVDRSDLAGDVAQQVFTKLSSKAGSVGETLSEESSLAGWLYRCTRFEALDIQRKELRRRSRERQAMEELIPEPETAPDWERLRPVLDEAMIELSDAERDALLLRYFKNHNLREVGYVLGITDDAAQKRVRRAIERLREVFATRGISVSAGGLALLLSTNTLQSAPIGLVATLSAGAIAGTTVATSAASVTTAIVMTTLQKTFIGAALAATVGFGIYEARQAANARSQVEMLQQQHAPLARQIEQLTAERDAAAAKLIAVQEDHDRMSRSLAELPKLRGTAARLGQVEQQLASSKTKTSESDLMTRLLDDPETKAEHRKINEKALRNQYAPLFKEWDLTVEQENKLIEALTDKQTRNVDRVFKQINGGDIATLQDETSTERARFYEEIRATYGEDRLREFNAFEETIADRTVLNRFNSGKNQLTPEQAKQLLQLLLQERAKQPLLSNRADAEHRIRTFDSAATEQFFLAQEEMDRQVILQASAFLSAEQVEALRKMKIQNLEEQRRNSRRQAVMFGK